MLTDKFYDVLNHEGVVRVSSGENSAEIHIANTKNSYLVVKDNERILIHTYGFSNINNKINMSSDSKEALDCNNYNETSFVIEGTLKCLTSGPQFDMMKEKFSFLTKLIEVTVKSAKL